MEYVCSVCTHKIVAIKVNKYVARPSLESVMEWKCTCTRRDVVSDDRFTTLNLTSKKANENCCSIGYAKFFYIDLHIMVASVGIAPIYRVRRHIQNRILLTWRCF